MPRAPSLLLLCLLAGLAGCNDYRNGPEAGAAPAASTSAPPATATAAAQPTLYAGTLPFEGSVYNLGCKKDVPVAGSLAVTVDLDDTPTVEAVGSRTFGPLCFNHTDELSYKGKLTKVAEGQWSYRKDSKNDTLEILVTRPAGADSVTVRYDNAHHCCGKPNEGNEGDMSGSAVLSPAP